MNEFLEKYILKLTGSFDTIRPDRKESIELLSDYISKKLAAGEPVNLVFICTHNSRRSHFGQIWAQTGAEYFNVSGIYSFSGGTEATAFNPRAVKALKKAGFAIIETGGSVNNPVYSVFYSAKKDPIECFSKIYSDPFNPQGGFAAVMTCSDADEACPTVFGAEARFSLPYDDPKIYDGTEEEEFQYDKRCEEIGREMIYLFNQVKNSR